ncbi:MAG: hypothetical protein HC877_00175 [Thioploca sp.]|nr:hypothetical protein [Thioploca sp.]
MIDHSYKENPHEKTSLVLAISALLYGTSSVYVLAEDELFLPGIFAEDGEGPIDDSLNLPAGFDEAQPLPGNVAISNDNPIDRDSIRMCNPSFAVNGAAMAEFPVTVNDGLGVWNGSTVTGPGWTLELPPADSWNSAWKLTVDPGTVITSILLEPFLRQAPDGKWYAFDVGGKRPSYPAERSLYEHTPDAARGQFIVKRPSGSLPKFTAAYSGPVYTKKHDDNVLGSAFVTPGDSTAIQLTPAFGGTGPVKAADRIPTHDLYSTLKIEFPDGLTGDVEIDPSFGFVTDTDCLPVSRVEIDSYENGILNFNLAGDGAVVIVKDGNPTDLRFEVSLDDGVKTFSEPLSPQAGSCYYMMDENTGDEMTDTYCAPN